VVSDGRRGFSVGALLVVLVLGIAVALGVLALRATPAAEAADEASGVGVPESASVMADLVETLDALEGKIMALAEAENDEQYRWRPMEGVRSVGEVFLHIAADNYFMPVLVGTAAPAETGITMDYASTVVPYESRMLPKAEIIEALSASFEHLRAAMESSAPMSEEIEVFGQTSTIQRVWVQTITHLHEHLGQSIAYARTNEVVPPWSIPPESQ